MSQHISLFPLAAIGLTAFALVTSVFLSTGIADASDAPQAPSSLAAAAAPPCACAIPLRDSIAAHAPHRGLDERDELAALESLHFALTEVADGSSYVWHRSHGRLSGVVQVTASFKSPAGDICRRAVIVLNSTDVTRRTETIACRMPNGLWHVQG